MARNPERNAYHTVGIPKDSVAYQRLVQEAAESNINIPSLIALRVADWYRLVASGTLVLAPPEIQDTTTSMPKRSGEEIRQRGGTEPKMAGEIETDKAQARANAEAAAEAWLD